MSEVLEPPVSQAMAAALDALQAAVERVVQQCSAGPDGELWMLSGPELLEAAESVHRARCRADSALHGMVREIDARGAATDAGAHSTAGWLRARLHLHPGAARRLVTTSRSLHDDPSGALVHHADAAPAAAGGRVLLRGAFAAGDVSGEHASVACETLAELPCSLESSVVAKAEAFLVTHAVRHDPKELARLGRHLRHTLETADDGGGLAEQEAHQAARQTLEVRQHNDGTSEVRGRLGTELTAELLSQLQPLAGPRPSTEGTPDLRTVGQRNADALAELLRRAAIAGGTPARHGSRASITVTMALETLQRRLGAHAPRSTGPGRSAFNGCGRPPEWTEAHHRIHWADGGETSVQNCCLFCDHHHRVVHNDGWTVELIDGVIHVIPPPWVDPDQAPRPNTNPERAGHLTTLRRPSGHDRR